MCWTESLRYSRSDVAKFASPSSAALLRQQSRAGGQSLLVGLIAAIDEMAGSRRVMMRRIGAKHAIGLSYEFRLNTCPNAPRPDRKTPPRPRSARVK